MAVIVYKKDDEGNIQEDRVEPHHLSAAMEAGWVVDRDELVTKKRGRPPKAETVDDNQG